MIPGQEERQQKHLPWDPIGLGVGGSLQWRHGCCGQAWSQDSPFPGEDEASPSPATFRGGDSLM